MNPAEKERALREGIARAAHDSRQSPIFSGMTQEQRERRIRDAVVRSESRDPTSTDPDR